MRPLHQPTARAECTVYQESAKNPHYWQRFATSLTDRRVRRRESRRRSRCPINLTTRHLRRSTPNSSSPRLSGSFWTLPSGSRKALPGAVGLWMGRMRTPCAGRGGVATTDEVAPPPWNGALGDARRQYAPDSSTRPHTRVQVISSRGRPPWVKCGRPLGSLKMAAMHDKAALPSRSPALLKCRTRRRW